MVDELHREIEKERQAKQRRADAKKRLEVRQEPGQLRASQRWFD